MQIIAAELWAAIGLQRSRRGTYGAQGCVERAVTSTAGHSQPLPAPAEPHASVIPLPSCGSASLGSERGDEKQRVDQRLQWTVLVGLPSQEKCGDTKVEMARD